ncbi:unnamed protein product, partial [Staurois parvus]
HLCPELSPAVCTDHPCPELCLKLSPVCTDHPCSELTTLLCVRTTTRVLNCHPVVCALTTRVLN